MGTHLHNNLRYKWAIGQTCRRNSCQDRLSHGSFVRGSSIRNPLVHSSRNLRVHRHHVPPARLPAGGEGIRATEESWSHTCSYPHTSLASGCCSHPGTYDTIPAKLHCHTYRHARSLLSARHRPGLSTAHRGQHSEELH